MVILGWNIEAMSLADWYARHGRHTIDCRAVTDPVRTNESMTVDLEVVLRFALCRRCDEIYILPPIEDIPDEWLRGRRFRKAG